MLRYSYTSTITDFLRTKQEENLPLTDANAPSIFSFQLTMTGTFKALSFFFGGGGMGEKGSCFIRLLKHRHFIRASMRARTGTLVESVRNKQNKIH